MSLTFRGGLPASELPTDPYRRDPVLTPLSPVGSLTLPLAADARPCVSAGDAVLRGQKIADGPLPLFSGVSGRVTSVTPTAIVLSDDGDGRTAEGIAPYAGLPASLDGDAITAYLAAHGIGTLDGGLPLSEKIKNAAGARHFVLNCCATEPYTYTYLRVLLDDPTALVGGARLLMKACGLVHGLVALTDNLSDKSRALRRMLSADGLLDPTDLAHRYPQEAEPCLIYSLAGVRALSGLDAGCAVFTACECAAVYHAFETGMPLCETIVTLCGDALHQPHALIAPYGVSVGDLCAFCGADPADAVILAGGPLSGRPIGADEPLTPSLSRITVMKRPSVPAAEDCLHCGRCAAVCPVRLDPRCPTPEQAAVCLACGCCSYVCPARRPLAASMTALRPAVTPKTEPDGKNSEKKNAKRGGKAS